MEGIGEILREARERIGFSFDQIEEATKINKRYLQALEIEDWSRMPGKVYAKGFLRTYARHLHLDENALCDLFELAFAAKEAERTGAPTAAERRQRSRKLMETRKHQEVDLHNKPKTKMIVVLCFVSLSLLVFTVWAYQRYYLNDIEAEKPQQPPIVQPQPDPETTPPVIVEPVPEPVQLTAFAVKLEATESCWLRLRDQEILVYEGTMRMGDVQEFSDMGKISLRIGNAGGLIITLNGLELPVLGSSGQIVDKDYSIIDGIMVDDETGEALS
ncbi:MAG: DUF4115 domain-containing protein [Clostridiales bacterium]|nr:DUF4115 domain-containing protein [Clostridiales bacterium]